MGCASSNEAQPAKKPSAKQLALENQEKKARVNIIKEYFNEIAAFHPFTTDKVATHSTEKSLWVIIDGRVHDCTTWQHGHPGGAKSIQQQGGKDATEVFHQLHSKKTKEGVALKSAPTYIGAVWNFAPVAPHGIPELFNAAFEPPFVPSQGQLDLEQQEAEARLKLVLEYLHGVQDQHPFTRDKVATHSTEKSLWVIIDGRVHDCTTWQHDHPGGAKSIQQQGGKDATEVFHQLHSKKTKEGVALKSAPTYIGAVYHGVIPSAKTFADVPSNFKDTVEAPPTTEPSSKNEPHSTKAAVRQPAPQGHLDLYDFRPVKVGAVSKLTDDVVAVTLTFEDKHYVLPILPGGHVSIEVPVANADPVYRSYSPMTVKPGEAVFIVRRYPNGKGSNYLHAREAGDVIQVRGPIQPKYLFSQPPATSTLVLLAGGTGAAPLYSIARDAAKTRRVHLVLCFRHKDGGLLVEESRALAASVGGALSVAEVYSQETDERIAGMANTFNGRFKETTLRTIMGANASPTDEIVICGPEPFNTAGVSVAAALGFTPALVTVMD